MIVIGERINTSRKTKGEPLIENAVVSRDADFIEKMAATQLKAGATYIDINCGTLTSGEPEALEWLTEVVQNAVTAPLSIDTPNPLALEKALAIYTTTNGRPIINSITAESDRYENVLPFVIKYNAKVIALAMDERGIQTDPQLRLGVARKLVMDLTKAGVALEDIFVDPLTFPIANDGSFVLTMLEIIRSIKADFPEVHVIAGISNVSHGLPARKLLNQATTILAMGAGLDAGIIDPNDTYLMGLIAASEALLGNDEFCMDYITKSREGAFNSIL